MLHLKYSKHANTGNFLESAIRIAEYYGFRPLEEASKKDAAELRHMRKRVGKGARDIGFTRREERALLTAAKRCAPLKHTEGGHLLLWRSGSETKGGTPHVFFELHVLGTLSTIAEALLIVVTHAIAEEAGLEQRILSINNIGSKESSGRYVRDVGTFLRKHIESISSSLRPRAATDPLGTLIQLIERGHPATPRAPQAMEYLTEEERRRFWELLEYLEMFGLPYELSPSILGSRDIWAHSLFQISVDVEGDSRMPIAFGGRYDPLASRLNGAPASAAMVSLTCEIHGRARPKRTAFTFPLIYYAHLGAEARRRSLGVLENLRRAGIPVHHGLYHERIGEQMAAARQHATPYVLIMGHKEAVEDTVLVREVATNSQEAIPLPELTNYLKRRRAAVSA